MTTSLIKSPVERALDHEVEGRQVYIGMKMLGDKPVIYCRLKGLKGEGWYFDARDFADFACQAPRCTNGSGWELSVNKGTEMKTFKEKYEKEKQVCTASDRQHL